MHWSLVQVACILITFLLSLTNVGGQVVCTAGLNQCTPCPCPSDLSECMGAGNWRVCVASTYTCYCSTTTGYGFSSPGSSGCNGADCCQDCENLAAAERPTASPTAAPVFTDPPSQSPTAGPTAAPSEIPSINPTLFPTVPPSVDPTAAPSTPPSMSPTAPSVSPTPSPTVKPSAIPSAIPTLIPTMDPSSAPTALPSEMPTARPTQETDKDFTITFTVRQTAYAMLFEEYMSQKVAYNLTIQHTVANLLSGVAPLDVTNIVITDTSSGGIYMCSLSYTVTVRDPLLTFDTLSTQLVANVASGQMEEKLYEYATVFGATHLSNCTFSEPRVADEADNDSKRGLSVGAIVGIVVGGVAVLVLLVALIVYLVRRGRKEEKAVFCAPSSADVETA